MVGIWKNYEELLSILLEKYGTEISLISFLLLFFGYILFKKTMYARGDYDVVITFKKLVLSSALILGYITILLIDHYY